MIALLGSLRDVLVQVLLWLTPLVACRLQQPCCGVRLLAGRHYLCVQVSFSLGLPVEQEFCRKSQCTFCELRSVSMP